MPQGQDENTEKRLSIIRLVLKVASLGLLPISIMVDDVEKEHNNYDRLMRRRGIKDIGISEDKDKGALWFHKKKKK